MAYIEISKKRELEVGKRKREVGGLDIVCFCRATRGKDIKEDAALECIFIMGGKAYDV